MKVLVTGGAGFIGSHLVETLKEEGLFVRVLDNFSTGKRENLPKEGIELIEGNISERQICLKATDGVEAVFHEAALVSVPLSVERPFETHRINVTGILNLLWAAKENRVRKFIFASSCSIYGLKGKKGYGLKENIAPEPVSPYASSKLVGEIYCQLFSQVYGLETICLRYFNVYGERQDPSSPYAAVVPIFITRILEGRPLTVYGDGKQTRDFVYVKDVVRANLLALNLNKGKGQVLNIGSGKSHSVLALIMTLEEITGSKLDVQFAPPRPGDARHATSDLKKTEQVLGFHPQIDFYQGLEMTYNWFKEKKY